MNSESTPVESSAIGQTCAASRHPEYPPTNLTTRCRLPELMDDPALDVDLHHAALAGLRRVNRLSRSSAILWPALRRLAETNNSAPLRVLDIASGGGDVIVGLSRTAHKAAISMQIDGCDISDRAIGYARQFVDANSPVPNQFFSLNALTDDLPTDYDVVMCSLFLHHLDDADALRLLQKMSQTCRRAVLVNDLRRTRFGYCLAAVGCHLLTRSPVVHVDGPRSVRAAWSDDEVRTLAVRADMSSATLTHHWPQRFLLSWRK